MRIRFDHSVGYLVMFSIIMIACGYFLAAGKHDRLVAT
jgi:hypothetical protein